jgi:choice-of-anchor B domain-containing protein
MSTRAMAAVTLTTLATLAVGCVRDRDDDGIPDDEDVCPDLANPGQADGDQDGVGDGCDDCPIVPDPDQADVDADGVADACWCDPVPLRCVDGLAGEYPCQDADLLSFLPLSTWGAHAASDVWGWVSPDAREYALLGLDVGLAIVDLTNPYCPVDLGLLPATGELSNWRDVETLGSYAVVVSEGADHGVQVLDLGALQEIEAPRVFAPDALYTGVGSAHTVSIDPESRVVAVNGSLTCGGGLHLVDLSDPLAPAFAGCFGDAGYVHDAQCTTYRGPDQEHAGAPICVTGNGEGGTISVVDLTDPADPVELSRYAYGPDAVALGGPGASYAHQGWFDEDQRYFFFGDELDEIMSGVATTTYVVDLSDLDDPRLAGLYELASTAVDHQQFVRDGFLYQSNYAAGLRVLDARDPLALEEVAYFDVFPDSDGRFFIGTWSNYPFLPSGVVPVSSMLGGLFVVQPRLP